MDYLTYCEEPLFFMKIYNSMSEDKRFEFNKMFEEFKNTFDKYYDHKLFNPHISFTDGIINIDHQDPQLFTQMDIREEFNDKIIVDESLLEDILQEFNTSHGLYVTDNISNSKEPYKYRLNFDDICIEIENVLD